MTQSVVHQAAQIQTAHIVRNIFAFEVICPAGSYQNRLGLFTKEGLKKSDLFKLTGLILMRFEIS